MGTRILTLEQVCKEATKWQLPPTVDVNVEKPQVTRSITKLHTVLQQLVTTLTLPQSLDDMLHELAVMVTQAMNIDLCVVLLRHENRDQFRMSTSAPDLSDTDVVVQPIGVELPLWEQLRSYVLRGQLPQLGTQELESLNPLKNVQYKTLIPVPLIVGTEYIGLLNCYAVKLVHCSDDDQLMLNMIASQVALAIKHRLCVEEEALAQKTRVKAFVDDLLQGGSIVDVTLRRRAYMLGYDLTKPHLVTVIEMSDRPDMGEQCEDERLVLREDIIRQLTQCMYDTYPGSLVEERDNRLICLLRLNEDSTAASVCQWLNDLIFQVGHERSVFLAAGMGNPCQQVSDYHRGFAEAHEALEIGQALTPSSGCMQFNALGVYRYICNFARIDTLRDQYQEQVVSIVEYDQRKKANLLDTLETYLECGGNIAKTSHQLDVHRNTLLQRIERLQKLCTLDLEDIHNRLPLLVAIKVHRLRSHLL